MVQDLSSFWRIDGHSASMHHVHEDVQANTSFVDVERKLAFVEKVIVTLQGAETGNTVKFPRPCAKPIEDKVSVPITLFRTQFRPPRSPGRTSPPQPSAADAIKARQQEERPASSSIHLRLQVIWCGAPAEDAVSVVNRCRTDQPVALPEIP